MGTIPNHFYSLGKIMIKRDVYKTGRRKFIKTTAKTLMASAFPVSSFFSAFGNIKIKVNKIPFGFWPVMITPFKTDLKIDYPALKEIINWYEKAGAVGFFANCGSSEMYSLQDSERISLTRFVVDNSSIPVVSTGTFFESPERNVDYIKKIHSTGVDGVVLIPGILAKKEDSDEQLLRSIQNILRKTDDIPLGLYECPSPYHRLISPELLSKLAPTNRFVYFKNTSGEEAVVDEKIAQSKDTLVGVYNAVSSDALHSIRNGGAGISPIAGNFYPELYTYLWSYGTDKRFAGEINQVNDFIINNESLIGHKYPLSSKYFMQLRGLNVNVNTRKEIDPLNNKEMDKLNKLWTELQALTNKLNIDLV